MDRFMLKVIVDYPARSEEREIIDRMTSGAPLNVQPVVDSRYIMSAREVVRQVYVDEKIKDYVLDLVIATRNPGAAGTRQPDKPDFLRSLSPSRDFPHLGGPGLCVHQGAQLCRSRRHQTACARCGCGTGSSPPSRPKPRM